MARSICPHWGAGAAVGRGQQDSAEHQLLAAFSTDIRRAGHIHAAASSRRKLKHHSALIAGIIRLPPAVFFCLLAPPTPTPHPLGGVYSTAHAYLSISAPSTRHICCCSPTVGEKAFDGPRWLFHTASI